MVSPADSRPEDHFARLIDRAHGGCKVALGIITEYFRRYLLVLSVGQIPPDLQAKAGASDLVQDTLLEACAAFGRFQGRTKAELHAWLRQIHDRNLADFKRRYRDAEKRRAEREVAVDAALVRSLADRRPTPAEEAVESEQARRLAAAQAELSARDRLVLDLHVVRKVSYEEVAQAVGCSPEEAKKLCVRALRALAHALHDR